MLKIPNEYSQWLDLFDALKSGTNDAEVLEKAKQGTLDWQKGVSERFTQHFVEAVNYRLNRATDRFQNSLKHQRTESDVVRGILSLRKEFKFLCDMVNLGCIPEQYRSQYQQMIIDQANNVQNSFEDSAKADKTGKLTSIVRKNRVNNF